ncbi:YybH family protein [Kocuria nitroreducens]|uniref:YybH family protein n=1 Tax=Kocuria nitroreducens TaxID=3058914 RepID=UPI0036DA9CF7
MTGAPGAGGADAAPERTPSPLTREEVERAAGALVAAFAATDTQAYFDAFAPEADFVFHSEPGRLADRASYERLWAGWLAAGWRVLSCESSGGVVRLCGEAAVFVHDVRTTTETDGVAETTAERETIVFHRTADGSVTAVHEHLSPVPPTAEATT